MRANDTGGSRRFGARRREGWILLVPLQRGEGVPVAKIGGNPNRGKGLDPRFPFGPIKGRQRN